MRPFACLFLIFLMVPFLSSKAHAACMSDEALKEAQFKVHSSARFLSLSKTVMDGFSLMRKNYVFDTEGQMRVKHAEHGFQMLKLVSYDDVTTPTSSQYGDIVFVFADEGRGPYAKAPLYRVSSTALDQSSPFNELVEVRWWDQETRHVVYNDQMIDCAVNSVPMAENALF